MNILAITCHNCGVHVNDTCDHGMLVIPSPSGDTYACWPCEDKRRNAVVPNYEEP